MVTTTKNSKSNLSRYAEGILVSVSCGFSELSLRGSCDAMGEAGIIGRLTHLHVCLQCWLSVETSTGTIHCISFVELF